jgi:hypothetical protein
MYIGQGVSLEACYATQAERRAANTAMAQASASAAAAAERASSASRTCLSPTAKMDSIASPPEIVIVFALFVRTVEYGVAMKNEFKYALSPKRTYPFCNKPSSSLACKSLA